MKSSRGESIVAGPSTRPRGNPAGHPADPAPRTRRARGMTVRDNREHPDFEDPASTSTDPAGRGDIAVVGVGCQYAGGVHDLDSLWRAILDGRDLTSPVPADRWDARFLDKDRAE